MVRKKHIAISLVLLVLALVVYRVKFIIRGHISFTSDEAIVGLMSRHILRGDIPLFYWGQNYQGTLQSIFAAPFLLLPIPQLWSIRISLIVTYALFVFLWILFIRRLYGWRPALFTGILLTFTPHFFTYWSVYANGGYHEILWLGTLILLVSVKLTRDSASPGFLALLGFLWGVAWWTKQLALPYMATSLLILALSRESRDFLFGHFSYHTSNKHRALPLLNMVTFILLLIIIWKVAIMPPHSREISALIIPGLAFTAIVVVAIINAASGYSLRFLYRHLLFMVAFFIGCLPLFYHLWVAGESLYSGMVVTFPGGVLRNAERVISTGLPILFGVFEHWRQVVSGVPFVLRIIPALICIGAAIFVVVSAVRKSRSGKVAAPEYKETRVSFEKATLILFFLAAAQIGMVLFHSLGAFQYEPRYMWGVYPVACACVGYALFRMPLLPRIGIAGIIVVLFAINTFGSKNYNDINPRTLFFRTDEALVHGLRERDGARVVYCGFYDSEGGYWIAYRLTFIAREKIIFLPYKESPFFRHYNEELEYVKEHGAYVLIRDKAISLYKLREFVGDVSYYVGHVGPYYVTRVNNGKALLKKVEVEHPVTITPEILVKIDKPSTAPERFVDTIRSAIEAGDLNGALEVVKVAFNYYPDDTTIYYWMKQALNMYDARNLPVRELFDTDLESPRYWLCVAEHLNNAGRFEKSVEVMDTIYPRLSGDAWANFVFGYAYFQLEQYQKALPYFKKAYSIEATYPGYVVYYARTLHAVDRDKDALEILNHAVDNNITNPDIVELKKKTRTPK